MSDSIDRVFVKAISTIRALSTRSGYGSLPRPPVENRVRLYGLYKQATEGNVEGIMARPTGPTQEDESARRKFDAWKSEEGLSKTEAKRRYISYLIETMKTYASGTHEARELLGELEYLWDQIKDVVPSPSPPMTPLIQSHSLSGSLYGDSFLADDRSVIIGSSSFSNNNHNQHLSRDVAVLKKEVGLALRRINDELNHINQRKSSVQSPSGYGKNGDSGDYFGTQIWNNAGVRKIGKFILRLLGNVLKRVVIDLAILISVIKFIKFQNGFDINLNSSSKDLNKRIVPGDEQNVINKFLFWIFKLLNKVNLVSFNRLYIEID